MVALWLSSLSLAPATIRSMFSLPFLPPSGPDPADASFRRTLLPLQTPPNAVNPPELPCSPGPDCFAHGFVRTTHLVPAAYPRTTARVSCPDEPAPGPERAKSARVIADTLVRDVRKHIDFPPSDAERDRTPLWNCLNRYVNQALDTPGAKTRLTLFLAHANGLPKETWEVALRNLFQLSAAPGANVLIEEVWSFEAVNHGCSALVNGPRLSGIFDWADNARDMLNFLLHYLPPSSGTSDLPVNLPRLPPATASARQAGGISDRIVAGIGHSLGGCSMVLASFHAPALFSSLMLIDPVINPGGDRFVDLPFGGPYGAVKRRVRWSSRADAKAMLSAVPFFAAWDPAVLDLYVQHGTAEDPSKGGVALTTSGIQEGAVFAHVQTSNDVYYLLPDLDERVALHWVMPDVKKSWNREDTNGDLARRRCWRRPKNSSNVVIPEAGHLIVQEAPSRLAGALHDFLLHKYSVDGAKAKL